MQATAPEAVNSRHEVFDLPPLDHSNYPLTGNVRVVPVSRVNAGATLEILSFDPRATSLPTFTSREGFGYWIEAMSSLNWGLAEFRFKQVFLVEGDTGLLCRILGLYSARGLDVAQMHYGQGSDGLMKLSVVLKSDAADAHQVADTVRVLVTKVETWVGVVAAAG